MEKNQGYFILKEGATWYSIAQILLKPSTTVSEIEIIKACADIKDPRRRAGQLHNLPLCLALFNYERSPQEIKDF